MSLSTYCVHSRSAKVKFDLCICGVGREEAEEQLPVGQKGVLSETARQRLLPSVSTSLAVETSSEDFLRTGIHFRATEFVVPFPGVQEAKRTKCSFQLVRSCHFPLSHPASTGVRVVEDRLHHEGMAASPVCSVKNDLPPTRLQESFQVVLVNFSRIQDKNLSPVNV